MNKQILFLIVIVLAVVAAAGGYIYWSLQSVSQPVPAKGEKSAVVEKTDEITAELDKDMVSLEEVADEKGLAGLDEDLAAVAEEETATKKTTIESGTGINTSSLDNLADELSGELDDFSSDLTELGETASDNSLDNLDNSLADF